MSRHPRAILLLVWIFHGSLAASLLTTMASFSSRLSSFSSHISGTTSILLLTMLTLPRGMLLIW